MKEAGFYTLINKQLIFAPNQVQHKEYSLKAAEKHNYTFPINGWYCFDTKAEAEQFFVSQGWEKPKEPEV